MTTARKRKPARPPVPDEHAEAVRFFQMVKMHEAKHRALRMLFAVPNGSARHPAVAGKLRAEGVRPGVSDYLLLVPSKGFHGLAIELKRQRGGEVSEAQAEFQMHARAHGYRAEVCKGWVEAWNTVCDYLGLTAKVEP